ncbi:galactokinase [Ligilactobacillus salivarius]|jgi:galactokinase|uniref:Galactokinase n=3 Tax=Bacilli TaxID=91061 RepID=GAL1_LIGS1|nr:galactokinase [Ligilactobacillus salivarius]Q1WUZ4.1 RecName: Full=Galactokinase; AltName: Full=Galactose kinase [Ligilactobacillus salivarius UCC118]ABD99191.1 Galactokinase [Ligilactobacillus salivarius UCC118]EFK79064.1 galactokinase [Ligilactobacillus salivarius ACS-116-V-Col5a]OQQ77761.1 galactokinase [Ligilactobacillus salivarius]OQR12879.1 galactokinase [Ligilactobacillus salivarius]OQR21665.1 galactokinase [Ligilactobacillus salivarius]
MDKKVINDKFTEIFGEQAEATFFSPGRINLIGEHTDYNGGHVFPCAISLGTYGAARKREDNKLRFYSANFEDLGIIETSLDDLKYDKKDNWVNYAKGMIYFLKETGHDVDKGMDIFIEGNIPNGSGLSSSASLEMLIGVIAQELFNLDIDRVDLVKLGMETENKFIGVNSGIMDQFAVGMGKQNQAILLDTNTLEYSYAPVDMGNNVIVIMNTNKRRELADSKYNERRSECETAVGELQAKLDIKTLGELDAQTFDEYAYLIEDENRLKRARHAVWENQRTMQAQAALEEGDLEKFGRLVNASHVSLEHDYEVTGIELDTLAHTAWKQEGVLGARMTGAGFGGCGIAIVDKDKVEAFKENVGKVYTEKIGYAPAFYIAEIADGTKVL